MRLTYSPRAVADLAEIGSYLRGRSRTGANSVERSIRKTLRLIESIPEAPDG